MGRPIRDSTRDLRDYRIETVDPGWLQERVKPKLHIASRRRWILCRAVRGRIPVGVHLHDGAVDRTDAENTEVMTLANTASAIFVIDETSARAARSAWSAAPRCPVARTDHVKDLSR